MALQPWQQGFVTECLRHHHDTWSVRLLLADEVGLGQDAVARHRGPDAVPAGRPEQQAAQAHRDLRPGHPVRAVADRDDRQARHSLRPLGHSSRKVWLDPEERAISPAGREHIARCPLRIGIVSTGLMVRPSKEKEDLLGLSFDLVILDEAHKARSRQGYGQKAGEPNELLAFMHAVANRADHVLLGTATPIQTQPEDLWDLVRVLHRGSSSFVLGNEFATWHHPGEVLPILSGEEQVLDLNSCLAVAALAAADHGVHQRAQRPPAVPQPARGTRAGRTARCRPAGRLPF